MANAHRLLAALQSFVTQRGADVDRLNADAMVALMMDWYRLDPIQPGGAPGTDALVYRYGGWSEGCATAFKFSVMRRVSEARQGGGVTDWLAGITLLFEPSAQSELSPFSITSSEWASLDAFRQVIENSPAFKVLANAKPMGAMIETGAMR
jgi:hypothetical protein